VVQSNKAYSPKEALLIFSSLVTRQISANRYLIVIFSSVLALLTGCGSKIQRPSLDDPLIGCWAGEDFQPVFQRRAAWFMNRKADGAFTIEFAAIERGIALSVQTEEGHWHHQAGNYTTRTTKVGGRLVDPEDPQFTDTYEVKSVAGGVMTYYHAKVKITFTSKKVSCERGAV
jgi:hypothetical protein